MQFETPLTPWTFEKRAKRFFMYGAGPDQVAHCPNTGSLRGILDRCARIWVRDHGEGTTRSLRYTAEICEFHDGTMVAINTQRTNKLVLEATAQGWVEAAKGCANLRLEAKFSAETRFDLSFTQAGKLWWGEVKQTTLAEERNGAMQARFPDAVTERGLKHISTLTQIVQERDEGALQVYVSTRSDTVNFAPAEDIHPAYAAALKVATEAGVTVVALGCKVGPEGLTIDRQLPVVL
jgi:sugar fermentation stimulation protein A